MAVSLGITAAETPVKVGRIRHSSPVELSIYLYRNKIALQ